MTGIVLFPAALAFDVLDKKTAGEPYRKALIKNIISFMIVLTLVLYLYISGTLFS